MNYRILTELSFTLLITLNKNGKKMSLVDLQLFTVVCPYCGEGYCTTVDPSIESETYYEDCQICCHPIFFSVRSNHDDESVQVITGRD